MILRDNLRYSEVKAGNNIEKISSLVSSNLAKEGHRISTDDIIFIMKRFFYYGVQSLLHGWTLSVMAKTATKVRFRLCYTDLRKINKKEKKIYVQSSKILSSMLYIEFWKDGVKSISFYPGDELLAGMILIGGSDMAYKYIRK